MTVLAAFLVLLLHTAAPLGALQGTVGAERAAEVSIRGVVLTKETDEPIEGAWVILSKASQNDSMYARYLNIPITPSATTDRDGRFEIRNVAPESYRLTVRRDGYVRQIYGQRVEGGHIPPIELTAGTRKDLVIHLTPAGNIAGVIRNSSGRPIPGIGVSLVRRTYGLEGERRLDEVAQAVTNDRGEYRFYWITPGRYFVRAGWAGVAPVDVSSPIEIFDSSVRNGNNVVGDAYFNQGIHYAQTYYPGVRAIDDAIAIDVQPRSELRGMDFVLERQRGPFLVRGRLIDSRPGQPPLEGMVDVEDGSGWGYGYGTDESFEPIPAFWPGVYWIGFKTHAPQNSPSDIVTPVASAKVVVTNSDLELPLTLIMPAVIKGRVSVDGSPPESGKLDEVSIRTQPSGAIPFSGLTDGVFFSKAKADGDGRFTLAGIPGEFRVRPLDLPAGFYLKEARLDGIDVLNGYASNFSTASRLELVISSAGGQIQGTVTDARSTPMPNVRVVLVPNSRDRLDLFQSMDADSGGDFLLTDIPPGDYRLFAWEALEPNAWFDPEVLARFESIGKPIHVSESSIEIIQVRVSPESATK